MKNTLLISGLILSLLPSCESKHENFRKIRKGFCKDILNTDRQAYKALTSAISGLDRIKKEGPTATMQCSTVREKLDWTKRILDDFDTRRSAVVIQRPKGWTIKKAGFRSSGQRIMFYAITVGKDCNIDSLRALLPETRKLVHAELMNDLLRCDLADSR